MEIKTLENQSQTVLFWLRVCVNGYERLCWSATGTSVSGGMVGGIFRNWGSDTFRPEGGTPASGNQDCMDERRDCQTVIAQPWPDIIVWSEDGTMYLRGTMPMPGGRFSLPHNNCLCHLHVRMLLLGFLYCYSQSLQGQRELWL